MQPRALVLGREVGQPMGSLEDVNSLKIYMWQVGTFQDNIGRMVRPERRVVLAGESPVRVSAGAPGSRLQPGGEIRPAERSVKSP